MSKKSREMQLLVSSSTQLRARGDDVDVLARARACVDAVDRSNLRGGSCGERTATEAPLSASMTMTAPRKKKKKKKKNKK